MSRKIAPVDSVAHRKAVGLILDQETKLLKLGGKYPEPATIPLIADMRIIA
ncbi:MAG: hypothetical protein IBX69_16885 [Anaerolineales bacterium]|nr:hypothetical protein [Anaerolineales bacterium]